MRAKIDINEVEARTKIRAKYLRAIENEEWDLLPGDVYVKSFLRTYGDYLGLDTRLLLDDFRRRYERPSDHELRPIAPLGRERERAAARGRGCPPWLLIGVVLVARGGRCWSSIGNDNKPKPASHDEHARRRRPRHRQRHRRRQRDRPRGRHAEHGQAAARAHRAGVRLPGRRQRASKLIPGRLQHRPDDPDRDRAKLLLTLGNA